MWRTLRRSLVRAIKTKPKNKCITAEMALCEDNLGWHQCWTNTKILNAQYIKSLWCHLSFRCLLGNIHLLWGPLSDHHGWQLHRPLLRWWPRASQWQWWHRTEGLCRVPHLIWDTLDSTNMTTTSLPSCLHPTQPFWHHPPLHLAAFSGPRAFRETCTVRHWSCWWAAVHLHSDDIPDSVTCFPQNSYK